MATRNKRNGAPAGRESREEVATPRAITSAPERQPSRRALAPSSTKRPSKTAKTSATAKAPTRGAIVALRLAVAPGGRDTTPRHEPHASQPVRETPLATPHKPGARKQFTELRDALASGFEIVQPVFARPLWSAADDSLTAYSFVLRRETATRLVTVPGGRLVERFIATHRLSVDERR